MKGEENLWRILQDKLETLRAGGRLAEALRIGQTALELAQRTFPENDPALALSYERLGQMHDQCGARAEAKSVLAWDDPLPFLLGGAARVGAKVGVGPRR